MRVQLAAAAGSGCLSWASTAKAMTSFANVIFHRFKIAAAVHHLLLVRDQNKVSVRSARKRLMRIHSLAVHRSSSGGGTTSHAHRRQSSTRPRSGRMEFSPTVNQEVGEIIVAEVNHPRRTADARRAPWLITKGRRSYVN